MATNNLLRFGFAVVVSLGGCNSCDNDELPDQVDDGGVLPDGDDDGSDGQPGDDDAGLDAGPSQLDAGLDGGPRPVDAGLDAGLDAALPDAGEPQDAGPDASLDAGLDAGEDAGSLVDAGEDAGGPVDAGEDAATPVCVPVTEACNGADDDCDGLTDEGLLEMNATDSQRIATPVGTTLADAQRAFSQLVPAPDGAAWLLTKPLALDDGLTPIDVVAVGAAGTPLGLSQAILPDSRVFIAGSEGNYLAVMWRDTDADSDTSVDDIANSSTYLSLFQAANDGTFTELDTLTLGGPADISELSLQTAPGGELRLLVAYAPWSITSNTATLTPTVVQALRYDTTGTPALVSIASETLPADARPTVHVLRRPCGEGWVVAYWQRPSGLPADRLISIRPMSLDGAFEGPAAFTLAEQGIQGFASAEQCDDDTSRLLLLSDDALAAHDQPGSHVDARELSYAHATGDIVELGVTSVVANTAFSQIAHYGGQWFLTLRNFGDAPTGVFELNVLRGSVRDIVPPILQGGLSGSGITTADTNLYFVPTHGVVALEDSLIVTFSNTRPSDSPIGNDAVAVTHRLACPAM